VTRFVTASAALMLTLTIALNAQKAESAIVVTEAVVNAPIEAVWKLWTTKEVGT